MSDTFDKIISADHPYKIGMYFGVAISLLSLANNIKIWGIEINSPFDWLFVFLIGLSIFFFFMGISLNTEERVNEVEVPSANGTFTKKIHTEFIMYFRRFNILSISCFWISGIIVLFVLIRFFVISLV